MIVDDSVSLCWIVTECHPAHNSKDNKDPQCGFLLTFGLQCCLIVRYKCTHYELLQTSKIALVFTNKYRILLPGLMTANHNLFRASRKIRNAEPEEMPAAASEACKKPQHVVLNGLNALIRLHHQGMRFFFALHPFSHHQHP